VVHREVKSANVLLSRHLDACLGDFGMARAMAGVAGTERGAATAGGTEAVSTRIFGTPGYIDPEYARTGRVSAASDIFSFGVVGLELLSSRPPYDETSDVPDLLTQYEDVLEDDAALPGFVDATCWQAPEAAAALATELAACLAPRARKRPSSRDVALRLTQLCEKWGCLGANASNDEESQCVVCLDARATHAVVPCGHVAFCADDGLRMGSSGQPCPMCRGKVERVMAIS
jgi:serine/threonine protein kinase